MLGQPVSMLIPRVVGFKLTGELPDGATATDLVLTITEMLREHGVVGKFVEFYGDGVSAVPLANRATIGNMSPEFGSTAAMFPIDEETITYLQLTGRSKEQVALVEAYAKEQGLWHDASREPAFSEYLELDLVHGRPVASPARSGRRTGSPSPRPSRPSARRCRPTPPTATTTRTTPRRRAPPSTSRSRRASPPPTRPARSPTATARPASRTTPSPGNGGNGARLQADPGRHGGRHRDRGRPRPRGDRGDHVVHQHLEPAGHDRRRAAGQERRRARADQQAVGEDDAGPRVQGRHGLLREGRAHPVPGEAGLLPGRLRLHDLHRQLRAAARAGQQGGQRGRPRRRLGALGQPQLRGPDQPRRQDELPGVAAAGHRLRPGRLDGRRPEQRPARPGPRRQRRVPARHLALPAGGPAGHRPRRLRGDVQQGLRRRLRRHRAVAEPAHAHRRHVRLGRRQHLRAQAPVLRRDAGRAVPGRGHLRCPHAGGARRLGDHRPHLARPVRSRPTAPPASTCASTGSTAATSTPTAPAAGTTRS